MASAHPFLLLLADLEGVVSLPALPLARGEANPTGDVLELDFAALLGLEPAPHRMVQLSDLSAADYYRMGIDAQELMTLYKLQGWPEMLCTDVAMLCTMHRAPAVEGSGKALVELWGLVASKPKLRRLFMYLLERVARAFPDTVRPELRMEVLLLDMKHEQLLAAAQAAQAGQPAPEPPSETSAAEFLKSQSALPPEERLPNA